MILVFLLKFPPTCLHRVDNCNRADTNRRHTHQKVHHFLFIIRKSVGVELLADGWVFGFLFFVLVENPFERGTVAESMFPNRR